MSTMAIRLLFLLAVTLSSLKAALTEGNETKQATVRAVQYPTVVQKVPGPGSIYSTYGFAGIVTGAPATLEDSSKLLSVEEQKTTSKPYQDAANDRMKLLVSQKINVLGGDGDTNLGAATSPGDKWRRLLPKTMKLSLGRQLHFQGTRRPLINFGNPGIADFLIMVGLGSIMNPLQHSTGSVPVEGK